MKNSVSCSTPMAVGTGFSENDSELFSHPSTYRSAIGALQYVKQTKPNQILATR